MSAEVRILNAALDIDEEFDQIIIRGTVDQETLKYIQVDETYQREQGFSDKHIDRIVNAYFEGSNRISDITLGMRGPSKRAVNDKNDASIYRLLAPTYCVNGGQRLYAAAAATQRRPDLKIKLGCKVYLNTTQAFENELFCKLGTTEVRIAPSILLRNRRGESKAADTMVKLNGDEDFALNDRITWDQVKKRGQLMNGYTLARVVAALHAHKGGGLRTSGVYALLNGLDVLVNDKIGVDNLRTNSIRFFDMIDKCWPIRQLSGSRDEPRPQLNSEFLLTLAKLMSAYSEFWDGKERAEFFFPERVYLKKLKGIPLSDYIGTTSKVKKEILYELLRKRLGLQPIFDPPPGKAASA